MSAIKYARRMKNIKASEIREILKVTEKPEMISFAGGLPAPELFPIEAMKVVSQKVLEEKGSQVLQYTTTEGLKALRIKIAERMNDKVGTQLNLDNIQIVSGSQQALDMVGKLFLDEEDIVICESPTYLGAINAFKAYNCRFVDIETDDEGMMLEPLEKTLKEESLVKMIYVIPDFQNPTGKSWSLERRKAFMSLVSQYDIPIIEDNPYGELTFTSKVMPSLKALDPNNLVISLGTFSKIFCPGLRIGWVAAGESIIGKCVLLKQCLDLHTSNISQHEINQYMELYDLDAHVEMIKSIYKQRRDLAMETMKAQFPESFHYTKPEGGLFTWVIGPKGMDSKVILEQCLNQGVAFVPGHSFFPNGGGENTFRLNFSNASETQLVKGLTILGKVLKTYINQQ